MKWLIEASANVFLEILGDLMSWTVGLVVGLQLDIGMESSYDAASGLRTVKVPEVGTLINPMEMKGNLLEETFPEAASFSNLFMIMASLIIVFLLFTKLMIRFGGPFVKSEGSGTILARTCLAAGATAYSYTIFVLMESLFNYVYTRFMTRYITITRGVENYSLGLGSSGNESTANMTREQAQKTYGGMANSPVSATDAFDMFGKDLLHDYAWGEGLAVTIIAIVVFSILLIAFFKLVLEIYERYIMLGILFYMAPLASSTLVSKNMGVYTAWFQMVISEFVVMCSNLFFTGVFINAWHTILAAEAHPEYLFENPRDFVAKMFLMIGWLIIGQQFDQHLKSLGLSTAQTGRSFGAAAVAGLGVAAMAGRQAIGAITGAGKAGARAALGASGMGGTFKSSAQDAANNKLAAWNNGGSGGADGKDILDAAMTSMGADNLASALNEQTGKGIGDIDTDSLSFENGWFTGQTNDGSSFAMHHDGIGGENQFMSQPMGNQWSKPVSESQLNKMTNDYANRTGGTLAETNGQHLAGRVVSKDGNLDIVKNSRGYQLDLTKPTIGNDFKVS